MSTSDFLFRVWPYTALALAALGLVARALLVTDAVPAARRSLGEALSAFIGGRLARASVVALLGAHLVGLLAPRAILAFVAAPWRLHLLEAVGLALGVALLAIAIRATVLHLKRRRGSVLLDIADAAFLGVTLVAIGAGLATAILYRWASVWGVATLTPWAASLAGGHPATALVERLPLLVRLHVFAGFGAIAVFPLTRLGALPVLAARRVLVLGDRPAAALAARGAVIGRRLAARLWPEPEVRWIGAPRGATAQAADGRGVPQAIPTYDRDQAIRLSGSKT
jgi:nitrate reductase gamma subunit